MSNYNYVEAGKLFHRHVVMNMARNIERNKMSVTLNKSTEVETFFTIAQLEGDVVFTDKASGEVICRCNSEAWAGRVARGLIANDLVQKLKAL